MSDEKWFVALDGSQLDGEHDAEKVRQLMANSPGRPLVVWNESMAGWADPKTLPAFRVQAAAPRPSAPRPSAGSEAAREAAEAARAAVPQLKETFREEGPVLKGLLDFKFETFVTPKVVRVLYLLCIVAVAVGLVAMIVSAVAMILGGLGSFGSGRMAILGIVYLVLSPVIAVIQLTLARIFLEVVLVLFRIKDCLEAQAGSKS